MTIIPKTREAWGRFLLFPFKVYVAAAPVCLMFWSVLTEGKRVRGTYAEAAFPIVIGYEVCMAALLVAAMIQFARKKANAALENLAFAVVAFFILIIILPMCATT